MHQDLYLRTILNSGEPCNKRNVKNEFIILYYTYYVLQLYLTHKIVSGESQWRKI